MQNLYDYLSRYSSTSISDEDFEIIKSHFVSKKLRKKQYLLQEGEVCKYFGFIVKGAMLKYNVDKNGVEHIVNLYIEDWWAGDRESFVMLTPTIYNIEAWEESEVLLVSRASTLELASQSQIFNEFILKLDERNNIATQRRITSSIRDNAKERYQEFAACYPDFLMRFPQHVIASYLGITKETLSRVRNQLSQNRD